VKAKTYKLDGKILRTLVECAGAWIATPVGRQYCSAEVHSTINNLKKELGGFFPPEGLNNVVRAARPFRAVPQIELTEKLAKAPLASDIRRRELVIHGPKTI
jgi:hypothetical protein